MTSTDVFDRTPPVSENAEASVLCAMMMDRSALADALGYVRPDDFYFGRNRIVFEALREIYEEGGSLDVLVLIEKLKDAGRLEEAGGIDYVATLLDVTPTAANVEAHAKIVVEKAALRALISASTNSIRDAYETGSRPAAEIIGDAENRLLAIARGGAGKPKRIKDGIWSAFAELEERQTGDRERRGISTGLIDLDRKIIGLLPGQLTVVAARPSMGKSALGMKLALAATLEAEVPTLFFSFEMSAEELILRAVAMEGGLDLQRLLRGETLSSDENARLARAAGILAPAPLFIDDSAESHISAIAAKMRRARATDGIGLFVVDYLQLAEGDGDGRREQIDSITRRLKRLARALDVPIVLLSQLSRGPESRTNKRPLLSDLRESGGIEQDADNVVMLYRADYYMTPDQLRKPENAEAIGQTELIVAKQRNGPTGTVRVYFRKESTRFENLARGEV